MTELNWILSQCKLISVCFNDYHQVNEWMFLLHLKFAGKNVVRKFDWNCNVIWLIFRLRTKNQNETKMKNENKNFKKLKLRKEIFLKDKRVKKSEKQKVNEHRKIQGRGKR